LEARAISLIVQQLFYKNQTFGGNDQFLDLADILTMGMP